MKKVMSLALALCLMLGLCACGEEDSLIDPDTGTIYPNKWYATEILAGLESYNCGITDAFPRAAGGVYATYVPVCRSCHEEGWASSAILSTDEPYETTWSCDCGTRTSVIIRYNP